MVSEIMKFFDLSVHGMFIDATFGQGGHSKALLEKGATVLAIDRDESVACYALELQEKYPDRFFMHCGSFCDIENIWRSYANHMKVDGVLFDLGFSSNQIEDAARGFSFLHDGRLDMRFDLQQKFNAHDFVNKASQDELTRVFFDYGQEKHSKAIAKEIVQARQIKTIETTKDLVKLIDKYNAFDGKSGLTRIFQAIRIHVNNEYAHIQRGLAGAKKILKQYGKIAVLTFHSQEDKIVKLSFKEEINGLINPGHDEIATNKRSRSSKLRYMIKKNIC